MGMLSWLFPSADDRVRRGRKYLEGGRPDEARLEVLDVDHPDALALLHEAETQLAQQNLDAALGYARAGDEDRVSIHLELAERFHHGGLEEAFRTTRREMRGIRGDRSDGEARKKAQQKARLLSADPLGLTGGPSWLDRTVSDDDIAPDREEIEQRLALIVENYPEQLRGAVTELGAGFARAVLDLEEGRADLALTALVELSDDQPLVLWERARTAHALGDPASAARALRGFANRAGGHHPMGRLHSGVYMAQLLTEAGDAPGALRVMRDIRSTDPTLGGSLYAQLLLFTGAHEEAEKVTAALIKKSPRAMPLYALLARVRVAGGHRSEAMRALEAGLEATHCSPGKCGYQAPDLDSHRLLATLYLEDGIETERALELADQAIAMVKQPTWEDAYLNALAARAQGAPDAKGLLESLVENTPEGDPRRQRAEAMLISA